MLCVAGDAGTCDPVNPGHNGSQWHAGNGTLVGPVGENGEWTATIHFDNLVRPAAPAVKLMQAD